MSRIAPYLLIAVGAVMLASNLGVMPIRAIRAFFHTWWPLILIVLGVYLLIDRSGK